MAYLFEQKKISLQRFKKSYHSKPGFDMTKFELIWQSSYADLKTICDLIKNIELISIVKFVVKTQRDNKYLLSQGAFECYDLY